MNDVNSIKNRLINRFLVGAFFVIVVALAGSLYRAFEVGFLPIMWAHIVISIIFAFAALFRHRLVTDLKAYIVVGCLFFIGSTGLFTFGLSGAGTFVLLGSVIFSRLFINIRAAVIISFVSVLIMGIHLYWSYMGDLVFPRIPPDYVLTPQAWINNITGFVFIGMVLLYVVDYFFNQLVRVSEQLQKEVDRGTVELEKSELILSAVLNTLTFGVMWKDRNLRFMGCNQHFAREAGLVSPREVVGKTDFDLSADRRYAERYREQDMNVIATGRSMLNLLEHLREEDGSERYLIVNRVPLQDRQGSIIGVLVSYVDITDTKKMEMALREAKYSAEQASKAKSDFLATMSHEIRTPINGVMGLLELVLDTELTDKQREFLTKAELSANTLLHIINQILDISKIEAGKMEVENVPFVPADILSQVKNQLSHMAQSKGVTLDIVGKGRVEQKVLGDPTKLLQILINLCSNAIKFTEQGEVRLTMGALPGSGDEKGKLNLRIEVQDTGIGIKKAQLGKLFDSFTQADSSTSRRFGGTGLGLAIVKQMLELQGGSIKAVSQEDEGTTFTCFISYDMYEGKSVGVVKGQRTNLQGLKVLLVEDNDINQLITKEMLFLEGASVQIADDGVEAMALLEKEDFDVVLMDIQMPRMDGIEAIKLIRADLRWQSLPVIALTANVLSHEVELYHQLGFNQHLGKPFQREQLVSVINEVLLSSNSTITTSH
ncbi:response regulator [Paraneptunicella aestuarii]|uniref:hybrid sensor histidine kinase/response regulator n=1 Tax=Paraneptunicella aestuarii TaxID=2831148 RepID=UPI001E39A82B|nr:PAS domain-containing sensor histidine kinase [Paraneptunicella aestuarii]UAA38502.1 response regulator [Paraneptunicella aestuarii]